MNPSREEDLFALALEKPATERADFLDGACHGDPALRQRLKALPSAHDQPDELLGNGVAATTVKATIKLDLADEPVDEAVGRTIGHYYPGLKGGLQRSQVLGYDLVANKYNGGWQASNDGWRPGVFDGRKDARDQYRTAD